MGDLDQVSMLLGELKKSCDRTEENVGRVFTRLDALPCARRGEQLSHIENELVDLRKEIASKPGLVTNGKTAPISSAVANILNPTWVKALVLAGATTVLAGLDWLVRHLHGGGTP